MPPCSIDATDRPLIKQAISSLSPTNQIYAAAGAKLYICPPNSSSWNDCNVIGALVLHRQPDLSNTCFLSVVSLDATGGKVMWQHEIYCGMRLEIHKESSHFVYFPSDKFLFGFLFTSPIECEEFVQIYQKRIAGAVSEERREDEGKRQSEAKNNNSKQNEYKPTDFNSIDSRPFNSNPIEDSSAKKPIAKPAASRKKKLTRDDIGNPTNFRHLAHIGFDPERGFDLKNIPPEWRLLFEKAGVTREQLENRETAQFILDFVEKKGGPPPIPPRSRLAEPKTEPDAQLRAPQSNADSRQPSGTLGLPPPLPPRAQPREEARSDLPDSHSSLMESIRSSGIGTLKKAPPARNSHEPVLQESNDMASLLASALANRQQQLAAGNCSDSDE